MIVTDSLNRNWQQLFYFFLLTVFVIIMYLSAVLGWGLHDATGEQSRYLRQVWLTVNTSITDCGCPDDYKIQTNVGPRGQDPCDGDSGNLLAN